MRTLADLAGLLRELRRRHARSLGGTGLTYRDLAASAGWSHGIIGEYLSGRVLPPTGRFDVLIRLLGASPAEQGALATARDRVEESRRGTRSGVSQPAAPAPRQLPMDTYAFTGREAQLAELDTMLAGPPDGPAALIAAVAGTAGVGKTALAIRWAHRVASRFPDGQLYADLRGYDPEGPVAPADALAWFLRGLGVRGQDIPAGLAERAAYYRTVLAGRRVLVLLDNAHDAAQVRPLLPGTPSCFVVVTSRSDLAGLVARDGARRIGLGMLTQAESVALLRTLIGPQADDGPDGDDTDRAGAAVLAQRCLHLPLALRIAAEIATAHPELTLGQIAAGLADEQRSLDLLDASGDAGTAVRSVFSWSIKHLSADAARAFGLLGLHPGPSADAWALAALASTGVAHARGLLAELAASHLAETAGPASYRMHDLLSAYAAERAAADLGDGGVREARSRLFGYYLHAAAAAVGTLFPHERQEPLGMAAPPTPLPPLAGPADAAAWLDRERPGLVAVAEYAAEHGWSRLSVDLSCVLWRAFEVGGHWQEALAVHTSAERAAAASGYRRGGVSASLGSIHWWLGSHEAARTHFERSLAYHRAAGDAAGQAQALGRLGLVHERLGDYPAALAQLRSALAGYRELGSRFGEGAQLINLGGLYRRLGRHAESARCQRDAAAVFAEIGEPRLEGYALGNLGAVESLLGEHAGALGHLAQALEYCRATGDRGGEASALGTIGTVYRRMGCHAQALDHLHQALTISRDTGDRSLETETLNALGETLLGLRQPEPALARHTSALSLATHASDFYEQARAHEGMARALDDSGRPAQAEGHWRQALAIYSKLGVPEAAAVRATLNRASR